MEYLFDIYGCKITTTIKKYKTRKLLFPLESYSIFFHRKKVETIRLGVVKSIYDMFI
jgi:hypothetical protein